MKNSTDSANEAARAAYGRARVPRKPALRLNGWPSARTGIRGATAAWRCLNQLGHQNAQEAVEAFSCRSAGRPEIKRAYALPGLSTTAETVLRMQGRGHTAPTPADLVGRKAPTTHPPLPASGKGAIAPVVSRACSFLTSSCPRREVGSLKGIKGSPPRSSPVRSRPASACVGFRSRP